MALCVSCAGSAPWPMAVCATKRRICSSVSSCSFWNSRNCERTSSCTSCSRSVDEMRASAVATISLNTCWFCCSCRRTSAIAEWVAELAPPSVGCAAASSPPPVAGLACCSAFVSSVSSCSNLLRSAAACMIALRMFCMWPFSRLSTWSSERCFAPNGVFSSSARDGPPPAISAWPLSSATSLRSSMMMRWYSAMCAETDCTLRCTFVFRFFARLAYLSVLIVSSNWRCDGETLAIMTVRQLPPRESFSSRVIFESRKGTWPLRFLSASAVMQLPSASSERLILAPSLSRCPVLSVLLARSEPARSTIDSLPIRTLPVTCAVASDCSMVTCSTACERLETWFAAVGSTVRYRLPRCSSSRISAAESAPYSVMPCTTMPRTGSSCSCRSMEVGRRRSLMRSL
mmetsp:Transcript_69640/g.191123  ORF Transcript_69640/g.191123 Transcript_69640/m.191123 type:complete len:401 (+) Transcript_69640:521-1723(+)